MGLVVILLLLANVALFALTLFDAAAPGEPQRLAQQVQPEKIRLLSPQEFAALGPAKVAALNDVCVEWGPLSEPERARAMGELAPLGVAQLVSVRRIETGGFAVMLSGFPSMAAAERRVAELRARGTGDVSAVDQGRGQFAIAFGVFRTEGAANGRADALALQGITGTRVVPRGSGVAQSMIVLRDPPQPAMAKLRELQPAFSGTDIRVGGCEQRTT